MDKNNNLQNFEQKYCLVQFCDHDPTRTEFAYDSWPLHCTLVGAFIFRYSAEVTNELAALAGLHSVFAAKTTGIENFAPEQNTDPLWVRRLEKTPALDRFHHDIVDFIDRHDGIFQPPLFIKDAYTPHVTMQGCLPETNEIVTFDQACLVDLCPNGDKTMRRVIGTFPLA